MSEIVAVFPHRVLAELARGALESRGIPAFVAGDDEYGLGPELSQMNGVRVHVASADLDVARELLDEHGLHAP